MAQDIDDNTNHKELMFRDFLLDSGATSHFTPHLSDLHDAVPYNTNVHLADSSTVRSKMKGKVTIKFIADKGHECSLTLQRVLYVPGLDKRLLSVDSFVHKSHFQVQFSRHGAKLIFDQGTSFTIAQKVSNQAIFELNDTNNNGSESTDSTESMVNANSTTLTNREDTEPVKTKIKTKSLDLGHRQLGHRHTRTLLTGSLHIV